jgi:hypothetical protein
MDPALKARLTSRDLWMRLIYMILFAIAYGLAKLLMTVVVILQFLFILLTGSANEPLLKLGQNLARYIADIVRFQTFNTEDKPFPFADWPEDAPGGERWLGPDDQDLAAEVPDAPAAPEAPAEVQPKPPEPPDR